VVRNDRDYARKSGRSARGQGRCCRTIASAAATILGLGLIQAQGAEQFATRFGGTVIAPGKFTSATLTPMEGVQHVTITVNKSGTFKLDHAFSTATVGGSDIADAMPLSDRVIYIQGKKIGTTNVSLFDQTAHLISVIDVEVVPDIGVLQGKIRATTGGARIRVSSAGAQVVLSGIAADAVAAERAVAVARGLAGDNVVNAMEVAPSQQVLLEVRFLEARRSAGRDLGINLYGATPNGSRGFRTGTANRVGVQAGCISGDNNNAPCITPAGIPIFATAGALVSGSQPFGTFIGRLVSTNNFNVDAVISALEEKGLVRSLAEPNLTALSGDRARFLAGGEFPVPVPSQSTAGVPTIAIEYKKFGVELSFTPTVLSRGIIDLRIFPSVSELDFANAVQIAGTSVPALTKRDAETRIELRDGQSFAIAGLLQTEGRRSVSQLPWVGSVPVLGTLFRSSSFQNQESDLVIIVTPHLISPATPNERLASPLDSRLPSNDVDFFLNGQPEVKKRYVDFVASGGGLTGPYGYILRPYGYEPAAAPAEPVVKSRD
jgi:pilus assembly protein CpaC